MYRTCIPYLKKWLTSSRRKPLVIRGARQVGKTWIVRHLAESTGMQLVELNFEKKPQLADLFKSNNPHVIVRALEQLFALTIDPKNTILFLDEIQEKPELFAKLRWFYEDMPELPVVAAGSLLEFVLAEHRTHMPVGRVSFVYLEPLSFIEYLYAQKKDQLVQLIQTYSWETEINPVVHTELMRLFKEYVYIGGLPDAVVHWVEDHSLQTVKEIHQELLASYRADFHKYGGRALAEVLNEVITAIPQFLGKKFMYSRVNSTTSHVKIKQALQQLFQARVAHKVVATAANGVPLGAEINHKFLKVILLDVGLCSALLDLKFDTLQDIDELDMINKGGIAEQVTGQLLRASEPFYVEPSLYYWIRTKRGSDAEIDYVIQHHDHVVPIEVKAGATGTLKSLHLFMKLKGLSTAVRIYSAPPAATEVKIKDSQGVETRYQLKSIPFYLISEIHRLLD